MSKLSSPRGCIWHVDKMGQTPSRVGPEAGRPAFEAVWPKSWLPRIYTTRRSSNWWRKSVEAAPPSRLITWLGRSATTWRQTDLSKSVEVPFTPINTPLMVKVKTPHSFCSSTCKGSDLVVVAQAKPRRESRVKSSLCSSSKSSLRDWRDQIFTFLYRLWVIVLIYSILVLSWALMHA
jgi:hypothetical protein